MGNKPPPPSTVRRTPNGSSPGQAPAAEGVVLRCPACTRTVRAPPGAARFRCPCGRVLAQPAVVSSNGSSSSSQGANYVPLPSQTRSVPPAPQTQTGNSNSGPITGVTRSVPPSSNRPNSTPAAQMRVRCPSCQQVLLAPNARKF
jgi:ribosomal protein S27E